MLIPSWSHSRIVEFEKCPKRIYLQQVEKAKEPERPLPPGKTEHANDRGSRVHEECEAFVRGKGPFPREASHFRGEFDRLAHLFELDMVGLEGEWGMNRAWEPTGWRGAWECIEGDEPGEAVRKRLPEYAKPGATHTVGKFTFEWVPAWLRLKLDAIVYASPQHAVVIDYKTGKKFGNELKHAEQLQLYQLVTFLRHPELEEVTAELWYLDADDITSQTFTRSQGLRFQRSWDKRGDKLTTCDTFPANPNVHSCKFCGYGPQGSGHCSVGVVR